MDAGIRHIAMDGTSRVFFSNVLRSWDNSKEAKWTNGTGRNTAARRQLSLG